MPRISKAELITLQKKLKTDAAIGAKFGITRQAVHLMRKAYGIPSSKPDNARAGKQKPAKKAAAKKTPAKKKRK